MKSKLSKYFLVLAVVVLGISVAGVAGAHGWMMDDSPEEVVSHYEAMFQKKAEILGMSAGDFKNAWAEGKSFSQIAQERGISSEELQKKMVESRKKQMQEQLQVLVNKGIITQQQADARLKFVESRLGSKSGMGFGWHGWMR